MNNGLPPAAPVKPRKKIIALLVLALFLPAPVLAQQAARKRPLTHADYDSWRSIQGQTLSRDGRFLAYALIPQDGDGEIVVRNLATGAEWRHTRGAQPVNPPQPNPATEPPAGPPPGGPAPFAGRPFFTADSRYVIFQLLPAKAETERAKRGKKKPENMPKNAMGIMDLSTGEVMRVERVKNFKVPEEGAGFIAYLLEPEEEAAKPEEKRDETTTETDVAPTERKKKKEFGSDLVLRNLADKSERTFHDVLEYTVSKDGKSLVYTVYSKKEETNGAYAIVPGAAEPPAPLAAGKGKYAKLTWDEKQTQLAFISDRDEATAAQPKFRLYHWDRKAARATGLVSSSTPNFRQGMVISDKADLAFSLDGSRVFFGVIPAPEPESDDEAAAGGDKVTADLWHWKDDYIQPMQKARAEQDRNRSFRAVYHLKEKKFVQLADETMERVVPSSDGRWAIGSDDRQYRILVGYDTDYSDNFLIDTTDGTRKPILKKQQWNPTWSPSGKYALFYDGKDWNTVSVPAGKVTNLTRGLGVKLSDEEHDSPSTPPAYGSAGWTADDSYVLVYDRYDIWQVAPDGSGAKNLTDGVGRKEKIQF
ncbi:MAG TPA: hypothetical protein VF762_13615, partial [Blastocatellia bacterium]